MKIVQHNVNRRATEGLYGPTDQNNQPADILLLQECNVDALMRLELSGAAVFRSIRGGDRGEKVYSAIVALRANPGRIYGLTPASTYATGACLLPARPGEPKTVLLSVYNRHSERPAEVLQYMQSLLSDLDAMLDTVSPPYELCIGGDFNIWRGPWAPSTTPSTGNAASTLMEWVASHRLVLATPPDSPTYSSAAFPDVEHTLDLTFSTVPVYDFRISRSLDADHFPISFRVEINEETPTPRHKFDTRGCNWSRLQKALHRLLLSGANNGQNQQSWSSVLTAIEGAVCEARPDGDPGNRKRKPRQRSLGWTDECQTLISKRDDRAKIIRQQLPPGHHSRRQLSRAYKGDAEYKRLDAMFRKAKRQAEADAVANSVRSLTDREDWICLNILRDCQRTVSPLSPDFIGEGEDPVTDITTKIGMLVAHTFPLASTRDHAEGVPIDLGSGQVELAPETPGTPHMPTGLDPLTTGELEAAIQAMDRHKSPGPDEVRPSLIKDLYECCGDFRDALFQIVDRCIRYGDFPPEWKTANVTMIPKLGNRDLRRPKSYRPISLLCTASKITESIVCSRLQHVLHRKRPQTQQYGGVPGISAIHAVATILDQGRKAIHDGFHTGLVSIDVASAFNQVEHGRLIRELTDAGLGSFSKWVGGWLSDRSFVIRFEGVTSAAFSMGTKGVPQGSPLSPLLWTFYLDSALNPDLVNQVGIVAPKPLVTGAYVDDVFALFGSETVEHLYGDCQSWIRALETWCAERDIALDKPAFLLASGSSQARKRLATKTISLSNGEALCTSQTTVRLLGVDIGHHFRLREFVDRKCDNTLRRTNVLHWTMRKAGSVPPAIRLRIARSVILPTLDYAGAVHPILESSQRQKVHQTEKAILCFVLGCYSGPSLPSGVSLAHELGQLEAVSRWRKESFLLLGRMLSHPNHSSADVAKRALDHASSMDPADRGGDLLRVEGSNIPRSQVLRDPVASPLHVTALCFPFDTVEEVTLPTTAPSRWNALKVEIHNRPTAVATEKHVSQQRAKNAVRIYTDGAEKHHPPLLGAGFVAYAQDGSGTWDQTVRLDHHNWSIEEAELEAIRLALKWCDDGRPGTRDTRPSTWKRIDIFSDSQQALRRLAASWNLDRKPLQHLSSAIRRLVADLRRKGCSEICFRWIPSHSDVPGNTSIDDLLKTKLGDLAPPDPPKAAGSLRLLRRIAIDAAASRQNASWSLIGPTSLLAISPTFTLNNMILIRGCDANLIRLLLKFRSNILPVASHRDADKQACLCGYVKQTREHLLLDCALITTERNGLTAHLGPTGTRDLAAFLQGGHFGDAERRTPYLNSLTRFLTAANKVLIDTNVANGTFTKRRGDPRVALTFDDETSRRSDGSSFDRKEEQLRRRMLGLVGDDTQDEDTETNARFDPADRLGTDPTGTTAADAQTRASSSRLPAHHTRSPQPSPEPAVLRQEEDFDPDTTAIEIITISDSDDDDDFADDRLF